MSYNTHGMTKSTEYIIWQHIKDRCRNPKSDNYFRYGARGIKVCDRWLKFDNFYEDMGKRPEGGYSIDRIDNDKDYEPSNCRWATQRVQNINRGLRSTNTSGVKGVNRNGSGNRWVASIRLEGKLKYLGAFKTIEGASKAREAAEIKYYKPLLEVR